MIFTYSAKSFLHFWLKRNENKGIKRWNADCLNLEVVLSVDIGSVGLRASE
jgi:hypothetical protein